jgi:hypothetical protein
MIPASPKTCDDLPPIYIGLTWIDFAASLSEETEEPFEKQPNPKNVDFVYESLVLGSGNEWNLPDGRLNGWGITQTAKSKT